MIEDHYPCEVKLAHAKAERDVYREELRAIRGILLSLENEMQEIIVRRIDAVLLKYKSKPRQEG